MDANDLLFEARTPLGFKVRVTVARWNLIVTAKHPVMADREDPLVPSTESRRLAHDFAASGGHTYLTIFTLFQHMDPTRKVGPVTYSIESGKLLLHLYRVLLIAG